MGSHWESISLNILDAWVLWGSKWPNGLCCNVRRTAKMRGVWESLCHEARAVSRRCPRGTIAGPASLRPLPLGWVRHRNDGAPGGAGGQISWADLLEIRNQEKMTF